MQYDRLFWLHENHGNHEAFRGDAREGAIKDPFGLVSGSQQEVRPVQFDQHRESGGAKLYDVVWTTFVAIVLVSTRVVSTLRREAFTGWTTYPVELYDKKGAGIPDYHGLAVTGRCTDIDRSRSRRIQRPPYVSGGKPPEFWVGLFFKDDRCDGSDIFLPESTRYIIVTVRVKNVLESLNIPNIKFDRLDTLETDI